MTGWRRIFSWDVVPDDEWVGWLVDSHGRWGVVVYYSPGSEGISSGKDAIWSWWADSRSGAMINYRQLKSSPESIAKPQSQGGYLSWNNIGISLRVEFIETPTFPIDMAI